MKALIFDLDGTLIDSAPAIMGIGNRLLIELGLPPLTLPEARSYVGHGAEPFVSQALAARKADIPLAEAVARFREIYAEDDATANTPYPGIEAALQAAAGRGLALGICTNKPRAPTAKVVEVLGWRGRFGAVVGGDDLPVRKPDPAPLIHAAEMLNATIDEIVYVGDSEVDAATAEAAGARFLLFTEGYRKAPVESLYHTDVFDDYGRLMRLVEGLAA